MWQLWATPHKDSLHVGIDIGIDFSCKKMTSTTTLLWVDNTEEKIDIA